MARRSARRDKENGMVLYVILGIAAAIIIGLAVVLARRGAQMHGADVAGQHTRTHRDEGGYVGGGAGFGGGGGGGN